MSLAPTVRRRVQYDPPASVDLLRWQEELDRLAPRNQRVSWLKLVWEVGREEDPVERFVIYQMVPPRATSMVLWDEGQRLTRDRDRWIPDPGFPLKLQMELLSPTQQRLFQEHGCYAQPFWIIQGTRGGHKRRFHPVEEQLLQALGRPTEPPVAGELPYAPMDERVLEQLRRLDQMSKYRHMIDFAERRPFELESEEKEMVKQMRSEVLRWLENQIEGVEEEEGITRARWEAMLEEAGVKKDDEEDIDLEEEVESFLNDTE